MQVAEKFARQKLDELHTVSNTTGSADEKNIKGFVLSTDVLTFKDIPDSVDKQILAIREYLRTLIYTVATDIEASSGQMTGTISVNRDGIQYDLPENAIEKYRKIMEANEQNNVSVRSVNLAIQLLTSINHDLMREAEAATTQQEKRKLYITQAAYIYEMADIVLNILNEIGLDGKPVLEQLKKEHEQRITTRLGEFNTELERIRQAQAAGKMEEEEVNSYQTLYANLISANQTSLKAWASLMERVNKQENWLNNVKQYSAVIEFKRNAAKHQLDTLRDIIVIDDITSLIGSMDELVTAIRDIELLELDNETVLTLLFGTPDIEKINQ